MIIGIVGLSHQGLFFTSYLNSLKCDFISFDKEKKYQYLFNDKNKINLIPEKEISLNLKKKKINFSNNFNHIKKCDFIILTEDVIVGKFGEKKISKINNYIKLILSFCKKSSIILLMSQVDIGFTKNIFNKNKNKSKSVYIINSPNTLIIGKSYMSFKSHKRIMIGIPSLDYAKDSIFKSNLLKFTKLINKKIYFTSTDTVELAKEALMLKLAFDVSYSNFVSHFSVNHDVHYEDIIYYLKADKRFSKHAYWKPSLGFAGGHTERSLNFFKNYSHKNEKKLINSIINYNSERIIILRDFISKININEKFCIIGLAYKENTLSTLNSFAYQLVFNSKKNFFYYYDSSTDFENTLKKYKKPKKIISLKASLNKCKVLIFLNKNIDSDFMISNKSLFLQFETQIIIDPLKILISLKPFFQKNGIKYINIIEK